MTRKPLFHGARRQGAWLRQRSRRQWRRWPAPAQGMLWMVLGGLCFSLLNTLARALSQQLDVYQAQFLRYLMGLLVMLPRVWRHGLQAYRPVHMAGQFWRGGVHTLGLILWFTALPQIPLADMTATQSLRFLDLVWASLLGWLVFADVPSASTWAGALVILLATVWIARRESRRESRR